MATAPTRPRRIPLEELARLPQFYVPTVSWAGDQVAFYWDKTGRLELYVMDLGTRAVRQVSHGEVPRDLKVGFVWERSDRAIVFGKDTDGNEQHELYRIDLATSEVTQLTHGQGTAQQYPVEFSPDNAWLTVSTNKPSPQAPDRPGQLNVWKMRADGSDYQPLTHHAFPAFGGTGAPTAAGSPSTQTRTRRTCTIRMATWLAPMGPGSAGSSISAPGPRTAWAIGTPTAAILP